MDGLNLTNSSGGNDSKAFPTFSRRVLPASHGSMHVNNAEIGTAENQTRGLNEEPSADNGATSATASLLTAAILTPGIRYWGWSYCGRWHQTCTPITRLDKARHFYFHVITTSLCQDWDIHAPGAFVGYGSRVSSSDSESNPNYPLPITR